MSALLERVQYDSMYYLSEAIFGNHTMYSYNRGGLRYSANNSANSTMALEL